MLVIYQAIPSYNDFQHDDSELLSHMQLRDSDTQAYDEPKFMVQDQNEYHVVE